MLIRAAELDAIHAGRVDLAFRRWDRPRLRAGTRMRTAIGLVEATVVEEHSQLVQRLDRLDGASRHGPWTRATLAIIDRRPAVRAAELAYELGRETKSFKRDVRKLKELGLTESLGTGYRLSPRGRALIRRS
ncbi:MAG: hypothetical protein ACR2LY_05025 [Thermoleophilaceae bacterium]